MALTLLLLRHAKSSWDDPDLADHDRPLSKRGHRAAAMMAAYLADETLKPDKVLCSTAERARRTLDPILDIWPDLNVQYQDSLYLASAAQAIDILCAGLSGDRVLLIGHNPTMEELGQQLQGGQKNGNHAAVADLSAKFPTGALAVLSLDCATWGDIQPHCGLLTHFIKPRDLEEA